MHADNTLKPSLYSHTLKTEKQQYTPCRMLLDNICQYRDKHSFRYMQVLFKYVPITNNKVDDTKLERTICTYKFQYVQFISICIHVL